MRTESTQNALRQLLEPLSRCLTPDFAQRLLELRADPATQARVDELADKATGGALTPDERDEYEAYVTAAALIAILQAKARALMTSPTAA